MTTNGTSAPSGIYAVPAIIDMAGHYDLTTTVFVNTFRAVAMPTPHTEAEFLSCVLVAREHGLNPLTKEIYFMKTKGGAIQPIVSVDGWMRKLNEHPQFDGLEFEDRLDDAGKMISVTCVVYRKDRSRPIKVTEYLDECAASGGPVWTKSPKRMLRHRALTQAARYAIGFAGVMDHDEFEQWQAMRDVTPNKLMPNGVAAAIATDLPEEEPEPTTQVEVAQVAMIDDSLPPADATT